MIATFNTNRCFSLSLFHRQPPMKSFFIVLFLLGFFITRSRSASTYLPSIISENKQQRSHRWLHKYYDNDDDLDVTRQLFQPYLTQYHDNYYYEEKSKDVFLDNWNKHNDEDNNRGVIGQERELQSVNNNNKLLRSVNRQEIDISTKPENEIISSAQQLEEKMYVTNRLLNPEAEDQNGNHNSKIDTFGFLTELVLQQREVCEQLQEGKHLTTSYFITIEYEYDLVQETEVDNLTVSSMVSRAVQFFLLYSYIEPLCDQVSHKNDTIELVDDNNDFRFLLDQGHNDTEFLSYVRGIGIGPSEKLPSDDNCAANRTCYHIKSSNMIFLEDNILEYNASSLIVNETYVRESILQAVADAFSNGTIKSFYDALIGYESEISLLTFKSGMSDNVTIEEQSSKPTFSTEDKNQSNVNETDASHNLANDGGEARPGIIFACVVLAVGCLFILYMLAKDSKWAQKEARSDESSDNNDMEDSSVSDPHLDSNRRLKTTATSDDDSDNDSTISFSERGTGSQTVPAMKTILKKSTKNMKAVALFVKRSFNELKVLHEIQKNRKQFLVMLEDEEAIVFTNITKETPCTAPCDDEMAMDTIIQNLELDTSFLHKSALFDKDVFANTSFSSVIVRNSLASVSQSKNGSVKNRSVTEVEQKADGIMKPIESTSHARTRVMVNPEFVDKMIKIWTRQQAPCLSNDDVLPYDEEKSLNSKRSNEDTSKSEKETPNKDSYYDNYGVDNTTDLVNTLSYENSPEKVGRESEERNSQHSPSSSDEDSFPYDIETSVSSQDCSDETSILGNGIHVQDAGDTGFNIVRNIKSILGGRPSLPNTNKQLENNDKLLDGGNTLDKENCVNDTGNYRFGIVRNIKSIFADASHHGTSDHVNSDGKNPASTDANTINTQDNNEYSGDVSLLNPETTDITIKERPYQVSDIVDL